MIKNQYILVDTCVWIEFFKTASPISKSLKELISKNQVVTCGLILAELFQGIKTKPEEGNIIEIISALEYREVTQSIWLNAGKTSNQLRKQGIILPLSDILLAELAKYHNCQIFTIDRHFTQIPQVVIYPY